MSWEKPKRCGSGASDCVETWVGPGFVKIRDSKNPDVELTFTDSEWRAFVESAKVGQYD